MPVRPIQAGKASLLFLPLLQERAGVRSLMRAIMKSLKRAGVRLSEGLR